MCCIECVILLSRNWRNDMSAFKKIVKDSFPSLYAILKARSYNSANKNFPMDFSHLPQKENAILTEILEKGYYVMDAYMSAEWCDQCVAVAREAIDKKADFVKINEDRRIFGAENLSPEFMEFYEDPLFQRLSDAYYGAKTYIGVQLANWIWAEKGKTKGSGGDWHRDRFERQFKAMVYLTDVGEGEGGFQMIEGSNTNHFNRFGDDMKTSKNSEFSHRMTHDEVMRIVAKKPERLKTFTAKKGTVLFIDTSAIHRGSPLEKGERFAIFNYFYPCDAKNPNWHLEKFSPRVPVDFDLSKLKG